MKRKIAVAVLIAVCFLLQSTVLQTMALASISPNLLLIIVSSLGFMRGEKSGIFVGFFTGILVDIFFGRFLGFYALLYMFIGYGSGLFHRGFYDEDIKMPMIWIALSELVYGFSVYFCMFILRSKFEFAYYFTHIILPELLYTVALTMAIYRPLRRYNDWLERLDEENAADYSSLAGTPLPTDNNKEEL